MDLENFDFRPLTDGLGFDKTTEESQKKVKSVPLREEKASPIKKDLFTMPEKDFSETPVAPVSRSLKKMLDSLPPSVDFKQDFNRDTSVMSNPELPVYREPQNVVHARQNNFDITLDNSLSKAFPKAEVSKQFFHQTVTPVPQFKEVAVSFASAVIDFFIILGLASLFVVSLVAITQVDLVKMLTSQQMSFRTSLDLAFLFSGVALIYYMIARGFFGSTLGDWAFDVQLGSEDDRVHLMYPFQVLFRSFLIILTGLILVPLVSLGFGKDMAYYFSGLKLYSRQY